MKTNRSAKEIRDEIRGGINVDVVGSDVKRSMNGGRRLWYYRRPRSPRVAARLRYVKLSWLVGPRNRMCFVLIQDGASFDDLIPVFIEVQFSRKSFTGTDCRRGSRVHLCVFDVNDVVRTDSWR